MVLAYVLERCHILWQIQILLNLTAFKLCLVLQEQLDEI